MAILKSLKSRGSELAQTDYQLKFLQEYPFNGELPKFSEQLKVSNRFPLKPSKIEIFQLNIGYKCNQVCKHCHVDAGPDRKEMMSKTHLQRCVEIVQQNKIPTVDITGGAPELHPDFKWFVMALRDAGAKEIIVRSNLTIIRSNKRFYDLPLFFKENNIHVISSLPYYQKGKTDAQRGEGVFSDSIEALKMLNAEGYGQSGSGLQLDLVYNPVGAFLPGDQSQLEQEFKRNLKADFGIDFNQLFTITNIPISRFLEYLIASDNYEDYMEKLVLAYNPAAVEGLMCRNTISVDWDGYMYDCDFNQMLALKIDLEKGNHIDHFDLEKIQERNIIVNQHCYGCTAGAGSSCQGTVA